MRRPKATMWCFAALTWAAASPSARGAPAASAETTRPLEAPGREVASIITALENLKIQSESLDRVVKNPGNEPGVVKGQDAFARAVDYAKEEHWQAAIYALNVYLNATQVPEILDYLKAQRILGQSYEALRLPARATRAYLRYIAAYITNPAGEAKELLDVVRHTLYLSAQDGGNASASVSQLLGALTGIALPDEARGEIFLYAAIAANLAKGDPSSPAWLAQARSLNPSPVTRGTALFFAGALATKAKNLSEAESLFTECVAIDQPEAKDIRNRCRVALARLQVTLGKPLKAVGIYAAVDASSGSGRDAAFETVLTLAKAGRHKEAAKACDAFLAAYQEGADVLRLRSLKSLLAVQGGALKEARGGIQRDVDRLASERRFVEALFSGMTRMPYGDVKKLTQQTGFDVPPPPLIEEATGLFQSLGDLDDYLGELRNEIRGIVFILGRTPFEVMRPEWENRLAAMEGQLAELLGLGERLLATERHLYADRLTPRMLVELDRSQERRGKLLGLKAANVDQHRADKTWNDAEIITHKLAGVYARLQRNRAEIASLRLALAKKDGHAATATAKGKAPRPLRAEDLDRLTAANDRQTKELLRALEVVRAYRFQSIVGRSRVRRLKNVASQVGGDVIEMSHALEAERNRQDSVGAKYLALDAKRAWDLWRYDYRRVVEGLNAMESEMRTDVNGTLDGIAQLIARHGQLAAKRDIILGDVEARLAAQADGLLAYYGHQLDVRTARNRKWLADIDWLTYDEDHKSARREIEAIERQEQMLKETVKDIEQGVR